MVAYVDHMDGCIICLNTRMEHTHHLYNYLMRLYKQPDKNMTREHVFYFIIFFFAVFNICVCSYNMCVDVAFFLCHARSHKTSINH